MQNKRFFTTQVMKLSFQILLYVSLFLSLYGMLAITNPQLLNLSRTAVSTAAVFSIIMIVLTIVYGGFDVDKKKKRSVFASIVLTTFLTDLVTYLQLQIMNVNPQNPEANAQLILFGEDFIMLLVAMLLQVSLVYFFVTIAYRTYFKINPPQDCCIITSSQELANHVASKMYTFHQRYNLTEVLHYDCPDIKQSIRRHETIFLAGIPDTEEAYLKGYCYKHNRDIYLLAELEDVIISTAEQNILDDTPFLHIHRMEPTLVQMITKRATDITLSLFGLIVTSPIILVTMLCLKLSNNGSIFFRQKRATIDGKVFDIIKFRTMYASSRDQTDIADILSARKNDKRITPLGRFLRKYRIDELPQLINVLRGDMSMVGPRPEMLENVNRYTREVPEFAYRQQMKAGLTGLAQIEGKYNTSPKDKAILDLLYIENFSLAYDWKLILRTFTIFFRSDSTEGFCEDYVNCPKMRVDALPEVPLAAAKQNHKRKKKDENGTSERSDEPMRVAL
ncbi:MAG: exopolysaccharide biosynthesis polyprenyl glycosylphosphotransferase [Clostridiales bacterium]|nr:exopolysaccharide biosynthesis polyprenyl glycosylphosphotransferase [Clostridiales bacterium]